MEVGARPRGGERLDAAGEQAADRAGEDVAGPRGRERGRAGRVHARGAAGRGDHGARALHQRDRVELLGEGARVGSRSTDRAPEQPGELAEVRGQHRLGLAIGERRARAREGVQRVGVEHERYRRLATSARTNAAVAASRDSPGPIARAWAPAAASATAPMASAAIEPRVGLGQRQEDGLGRAPPGPPAGSTPGRPR